MHARSTLAHVHVHHAYAGRQAGCGRQASRLLAVRICSTQDCGFDYYYYYYCITPLAGVETTCHCWSAVCELLVKSLFAVVSLHVCLLLVVCFHAYQDAVDHKIEQCFTAQ